MSASDLGVLRLPPMGEAGDVYTALMDIPAGMWTLTVSIKQGDCVGGENFVISEDELVRLWIDLTCELTPLTIYTRPRSQ